MKLLNRIAGAGFATLAAAVLAASCGDFRGKSGEKGSVGAAGVSGASGESCVVTEVDGGALVTCGDQSVIVSEGRQGETGSAGSDGSDGADVSSFEVVDPCGDAAGVHDEVLLRLQDGTVIASFSDSASGKNTRFSVLTAGSYVTTDGSGCVFTVTEDGEIVSEEAE